MEAKKGCKTGCKNNILVVVVLLILFLAGIIPSLIDTINKLDFKFVYINEEDILQSPITAEDHISLVQKLNNAGLNDLADDLSILTYENNNQTITQDLCLTDNELGVFVNFVFFDNGFELRELNIIENESIRLEFKLKIDIYAIINSAFLQDFFIYAYIAFDIELIEGMYISSNPISYLYGYEDYGTNYLIQLEDQAQDIMIFFNGNNELPSMATVIGADSLEWKDEEFIAKINQST